MLGLAGNVLSRRFEFQADGFAVSLGRSEPLKGALHKLDVKNRSAVNVDAWCAHQFLCSCCFYFIHGWP